MQTKQTAANLAILALARSVAADLQALASMATEAEDAATIGDLNLTVGTLLPVRDRLDTLRAQLDAAIALHRAGPVRESTQDDACYATRADGRRVRVTIPTK